MPRPHAYNPLLKSYPDSEKINKVSEGAETLYTRLLAICDDNACFWGDPKLVLVKAYSQRWASGQLMFEDVADRLEELRAVELIRFYHHGDKAYLQVLNCFKTLRRDVKRICLFPEPPAPATAVQIQEAAEGQEEPQEGTQALFQTDQGGNGSGTDAGRTRPGPGPDTAWQKRPDQTRPEGGSPRSKIEEKPYRILVSLFTRWKRRDGHQMSLTPREAAKLREVIQATTMESQLYPEGPNVKSAGELVWMACRELLEQKHSPRWTNIDYALGCVRSKTREIRDGVSTVRINQRPEEIRDARLRYQLAQDQKARELEDEKTEERRIEVENWFNILLPDEVESFRVEAVSRFDKSFRMMHLSQLKPESSSLLRDLMFQIVHESEVTAQESSE